MKKCSKCKLKKPLEKFGNDAKQLSGKRPDCKECHGKVRQQYNKSTRGMANKIIKSMRKRSRVKNFQPPEFTIDDVENIMLNSKCEITNRRFDPFFKSDYQYNPFMVSPDRKDNSLGYTKRNVQWVCVWVNFARGPFSIKDFKSWIKRAIW